MARSSKAKAKASVKEEVLNGNDSDAIAAQIEAFLATGKKIQEIPIGTSGITHTGGTKHITISRNKG